MLELGDLQEAEDPSSSVRNVDAYSQEVLWVSRIANIIPGAAIPADTSNKLQIDIANYLSPQYISA